MEKIAVIVTGNDTIRDLSIGRTYAVVGFGEAPSTLWVWVPGLPKYPSFSGAFRAVALKAPEKEDLGGTQSLQTTLKTLTA
jgi:hypothetical protein